MTQDWREKLKAKGWSDEDIEKTLKIMDSAHEKKNGLIMRIDTLVYWAALLVAIVGNFFLSVVLIPFLIVLSTSSLIILISVIAIAFGALYQILLDDIEKLDTHHHIIAGVFIPAVAIINIMIIVNVANHLNKFFTIVKDHNPILISVVYVFAFTLPWMVHKLRERAAQAS